jgi:hypothetical protein
VLRIANDADDIERHILDVGHVERNRPGDHVTTSERGAHKRFVDDGDAWRVLPIVAREAPARDNAHAGRIEVGAGHVVDAFAQPFSRPRGIYHGDPQVRAAEQPEPGQRDRSRSGHRLQRVFLAPFASMQL